MRLLLIVVLLISAIIPAFTANVITIDPNTPTAAADNIKQETDLRLAQRVTYEARHKRVSEVLTDLTTMTNVTLYAGYNNGDWQVRDRRMNIFAKDITLADLITSIARVMKFKWSINDDMAPITYRLYMDRRTLLEEEGRKYRDEEKQKQLIDERRKEAVESISRLASATPEEIVRMRETDPYSYLLTATGIAPQFSQLMQACPQIKDALMSGEETTLSAGKLSPQAQQALLASMQAMWLMNTKTGQGASLYNSDGTQMARPQIPADIDQKLDKVRIEIKSNVDLSSSDPFAKAELAGVTISFDNNYAKDGHTYGLNDDVSLMFMDPSHPVVKAIASLYAQMIDGDTHAMEGGFSVPMSSDDMNPPNYGETPVKHSEEEKLDPALAKELELKNDEKQPQEENLADAVKARKAYEDILAKLAESTGLSIVSDSYNNYTSFSLGNDKLSAEKTLEALSMGFKLNWWKQDNTIELRDRFWFRKRSAQIPEKTLEGWRSRFVETGYMDIDDLTQICTLTKEQFEVNIRGDETLDQFSIWNEWASSNSAAPIYRALDSDQQKVLKNCIPIELSSMSPAQWLVVEKTILRQDPTFFDNHNPKLCSLTCKREMIGTAPRYSFTIVETQSLESAGPHWEVYTPKYERPNKADKSQDRTDQPNKDQEAK